MGFASAQPILRATPADAGDLPVGHRLRFRIRPFVQPVSKKYFCFSEMQIRGISRPVPSHSRGGSRSSRTRGGMRWTRVALLTRALIQRTAKSCGPDAPTLASSLRNQFLQATVARKPGHRGERGISRKTIARGMPGVSGVTVVTTLVCHFCFRTQGCGRSERPAFPAPSE
jgi:hypothetical protein